MPNILLKSNIPAKSDIATPLESVKFISDIVFLKIILKLF